MTPIHNICPSHVNICKNSFKPFPEIPHKQHFTSVGTRPSLYSLFLLQRCWSQCALSCFLACVHGLLRNHMSGLWGAAAGSCHLAAPGTICPLCMTSCWRGEGMCAHNEINQTLPTSPLEESRPGQLPTLRPILAITPYRRSHFHLVASQPHPWRWMMECSRVFCSALTTCIIPDVRYTMWYMQWRCVKVCFMDSNKFTAWCGFEPWLEFHTRPRTHDISFFCNGIMRPETLRRDSDERGMKRGPRAHFYLLTAWRVKLCCPDEIFCLTDIKQTIHTKALITLLLANRSGVFPSCVMTWS